VESRVVVQRVVNAARRARTIGRHGWRRATERPRLAWLGRSEHPLAGQVLGVWREYVDDVEPEARDWSARVEAERARLCNALGSDAPPLAIRRAAASSKRRSEALFLYGLVRARKPARIVEMGTNVGISSAYLAGAQRAAGVASPRLVTLEGHTERVETARAMHQRLGLDHVEYVAGNFSDTFEKTLAEHGPFDLAFLDGDHQFEPTLRYFERVLEHVSEDALLVFDDIHWSPGMDRAWSRIRRDERVRFALDVGRMGLCALGGPRSRRFAPPSLFVGK